MAIPIFTIACLSSMFFSSQKRSSRAFLVEVELIGEILIGKLFNGFVVVAVVVAVVVTAAVTVVVVAVAVVVVVVCRCKRRREQSIIEICLKKWKEKNEL